MSHLISNDIATSVEMFQCILLGLYYYYCVGLMAGDAQRMYNYAGCVQVLM